MSKRTASLPSITHERILETPEVHVVRVPFVYLGLDSMNCYIVRDGDDALVIDPGASAPFAWRAFERVADRIGIDLARTRFLCTHLHFDHASLLKKLTHPGSQILMGHAAFTSNPWNFYLLRNALLKSVLIEEGMTPSALKSLAAVMLESRVCDLLGCEYELLHEGQVIRVGAHELRVLETPGHTAGCICLYSAKHRILFSGDHVLQGITPVLALPFEGKDSLRNYLDSLAKVESLACDTVLPGHGKPFTGLLERCNALRQRHAERLGQTWEIVARNPGCNGSVVVQAIPWTNSNPDQNWNALPPLQRITMTSQALSYLEYLVNIGEFVRKEDSSGRHYFIRE